MTSKSIRICAPPLVGFIFWGTLISCVSDRERRAQHKSAPAPRIEKLVPQFALIGKGFSVQPTGDSAISVIGSNFQHGAKVHFDNRALFTTYGSESGLTALVAPELYKEPKTYQVTVENPDGGVSNSVPFSVLGVTGPAPQISRVWPAKAVASKPFNVQPDGSSALGIEGSNYLPGAAIQFDGVTLDTVFGSPGALTAVVPANLLKKPHAAEIRVKNPDGKASKTVLFTIEATDQ